MQKISTYLYPNRIELLADLAGFTVEYTNVYQRNIKIYNGIDNVLEFDIKNADQKRIDLSTLTQIELNIMDAQGNALPNSPYAVTPLSLVTGTATSVTRVATTGQATETTLTVLTANITTLSAFIIGQPITGTGIVGSTLIKEITTDVDTALTTITVSFAKQTVLAGTNLTVTCSSDPLKGLATATIPEPDLVDLDSQFLRYSVTALKDGKDVMLYGDTRFGAVGKMELVGDAMPTFRDEQVITSFFADLAYSSLVLEQFHSSAIPVKFYEAVPTTDASFDFRFSGLEGTVTVEATKDATISSESFTLRGTIIESFAVTANTAFILKHYADLDEYAYLRVSYVRVAKNTGKITKVSVS